jgi:ATP-dependent DNA helicase RecQ
MEPDPRSILKTFFGYPSFRPGQEEVITAILAGKDVLAVMPTGAGKSLCYQVPALLLEGLTVVVSPLISLMKDQVNALVQAGVEVAYLNSSLSPAEYAETMRRAFSGEYRLLYIAPERLFKGELVRLAESRDIPLVVIDEAHCVSQWGHDFRPSYLRIAEFIRSLKNRPATAAFTATATVKVKEDILRALELRRPFTITTGFDRKNLYFGVKKPRNKEGALLDYLAERKDRSGIVYCATRKTTDEIWDLLRQQGFAAARYHAGLDDRERRDNQDDFLYDRKTIMVATNAFGMGIDKSNVSFVIHYNMPKNIESYYQEAGRAGRDGEPAECILFYSGQDVRINQYLITNSRDDEVERDESLIQHNLELLKSMTFYATGTDCLRARLLNYFGEHPPGYCGNCSNCNTLYDKTDITQEARKIISCVYRLKQRGRSFGKTMIIDILRGSKNEKIKNAQLDTLSTYGIMADTETRRIRIILDYLIDQGYLALGGDEYPVVEASASSGEIIFDKKPLSMMLPRESAPPQESPLSPGPSPRERSRPSPGKRSSPAAVSGEGWGRPTGGGSRESQAALDEALLAKLRDLRKTLAQEAKVPAYVIFADASLADMCRKRPVTAEQFRQILGVGDIKLEKYGAAFTALIREHRGP